MNKKIIIPFALALIGAAIAGAWGQSAGVLPAWNLLGNPSSSPGLAQTVTITQMLDGAFCNTQGDLLQRGASVWGCATTPLSPGNGGSGVANTKNLTWSNALTFAGTDSTTMTFPSTNGTIAALNIQDQTLTGGANVTSNNLGTISSGTTTVDCGKGPLQYFTNNGAFTFAAPSNDGSCIFYDLNGSSAGTITFSGFTESANTGDTLNNTNTDKFFISVVRINGVSNYVVRALQ